MIVECYEPAYLTEGKKCSVLAGATDTLKFPAVDSCLAITLILKDGGMLGFHVGLLKAEQVDPSVKDEKPNPWALTRKQALAFVKENKISLDDPKAVFVGDKEWEEQYQVVSKFRTHFDVKHSYFYKKGGKAVDISVEGSTKKVLIYPSGSQTLEKQFSFDFVNGHI
jgi:hypothetical protein